MAAERDRRAGRRPAEIDAVFVTPEHWDPQCSLRHFARACWLAATPVAERLSQDPRGAGRGEAVGAADGA
jgi:hypothetical protein